MGQLLRIVAAASALAVLAGCDPSPTDESSPSIWTEIKNLAGAAPLSRAQVQRTYEGVTFKPTSNPNRFDASGPVTLKSGGVAEVVSVAEKTAGWMFTEFSSIQMKSCASLEDAQKEISDLERGRNATSDGPAEPMYVAKMGASLVEISFTEKNCLSGFTISPSR